MVLPYCGAPDSANVLFKQRSCLDAVQPGTALVQMLTGLPATHGSVWKFQATHLDGQELQLQGFCVNPAECLNKKRPGEPCLNHSDLKHRTSKNALWLSSSTPVTFSFSTRPIAAILEEDLRAGTLGKRFDQGELREAVETLDLLVQRGCSISDSLFYDVLRRCITQNDLSLGRRVHALAHQSGYESNAFLAHHIIRMYSSHGRLEEARQVFGTVGAPNSFMWASIILAHARHGQPTEAINLYGLMRKSNMKPDNHIFVAVLKACAAAADLVSGRKVHADILESTVMADVFVGNSLVNMYAKCGSLKDAREVFDTLPKKDAVTWNAMISGYVHHGLGQEALALYSQMDGTGATRVTFVCLLQACCSIESLHEGRLVHAQIQQRGLEADEVVGNCLVDMYAKCGCLISARGVFDRMPRRSVVTWTAMIAGYVQHGLGQAALTLYASMEQVFKSRGDRVIFGCLLKACGSVGALQQGEELHAHIRDSGLEADMFVGNCLVDMYAKCGRLRDAQTVLEGMPKTDVVTWTAMLNGYARQGESQMAIQYFSKMQEQGVRPDETTFSCLLVACCHGGLLREGEKYFKMMADYGVAPTDYHYSCMVDLLGRSGRLEEAENMLEAMPFQNDFVGWTSLLTACKNHGDSERGVRCFKRLVDLEPESAAAYVLLANIYASTGRWNTVDEIESLRKSACAWKKPAKACIEVRRKVHEFTVGEDRSEIASKVKSMNLKLKQGGHVPNTGLVLKAVPEEEKENALCGHAEKLALAYGLLNTPCGTTLLVTKNLRMCNDCHSSTKVMSHIEKREIIVRDARSLHRFWDGSCSCGDRQ